MNDNNWKNNFASFDGKIWLNAASEGPLPLNAAHALEESVGWKSKPYLLDNAKFASVPLELKQSLGKLIGVKARDVILANSASYGLHLLANGLPWRKNDEIILMANDFPTDILPWLALEKQGVNVRQISARHQVIEPEDLAANISSKTKLFCISHVHTFTGVTVDVEGLAKICQQKNIIFVLNCSQSVGTMPIDLSRLAVDAVVSAGYKWLCGPYGTGFCWIRPELRDKLTLNQAYWVSLCSQEDLKSEGPLTLRDLKSARSARKFDVFGTANFFNFVPWRAAIDFWLEIGIENVQAYHQTLIDRLIQGLGSQYELISPREGNRRSSIVVISHRDKTKNQRIFDGLVARGIYPAFWKNNIRISAHVYNTAQEIDRLLTLLKDKKYE
ncbi:MAG: aminotransferase class V-fold PLP-dependent enzyme [Candidatus Omnitrophota bacterium]|nr:aminotransferase class V-fold PLP-dependent enzyme [Candidatus Omnitrophota bacterium]